MPLDNFRPINRGELFAGRPNQPLPTRPTSPAQPGTTPVTTTPTGPGTVNPNPPNMGIQPVPLRPGPNPLYPEPGVRPGPTPPYPERPGPTPPYPEPSPRPPGPRPPYPEPPGSTVPPGPPNMGIMPVGPGTTVGNPAAPPGSFSPNSVVQDNLAMLLNSNSPYMRNAQQRGLEQAASRGLLNGSMAAGAAQRSAIEAANPILNQIMGLTSQREGQAHQSSENSRNRQFQAEFAQMNAQLQDWMSNNDFNRNFNGQLAMLPIASAADMWSSLMNLAAEDPTVFTPDVLAGYQDFFQTGFQEYISRFLQPPTGG